MEAALARLEQRVTTLEAKHDDLVQRNSKAHKEFFDGKAVSDGFQARTEEQYKHLVSELSKMSVNQDKMAKDIEEIKQKPGKRWDGLMGSIIQTIGGGIGGAIIAFFVMSQVG